MSAPRKITAWGTGRKLSLLGGSPDFQHLYHHDDVVRELVEALTAAKKFHDADHGCNGFTCDYEVLRLQIDTALAKIAQEDGE